MLERAEAVAKEEAVGNRDYITATKDAERERQCEGRQRGRGPTEEQREESVSE